MALWVIGTARRTAGPLSCPPPPDRNDGEGLKVAYHGFWSKAQVAHVAGKNDRSPLVLCRSPAC